MTTIVTVKTGGETAAKVTIEQDEIANDHIVQPNSSRDFHVWDAVKLTVVEYDDDTTGDASDPEAEHPEEGE